MSFSEATLLRKIQDVNNTQQSIQTLSLWLIHHRKHSKTIVQTWLSQLCLAPRCERKITFIYLSNDILQNSRKKGQEFLKEFLLVLPDAIENTSRLADSKSRFTLERIFNIWKDRKIYNDDTIKKFKVVLHGQPKVLGDSSDADSGQVETAETGTVKSKSKIVITKSKSLTDTTSNGFGSSKKSDGDKREDDLKRKKMDEGSKSPEVLGESSSKQLKNSLRDEVLKELSNSVSTVPAPEPLELISMLQDLEKSASSDAIIREKIAELPSQVHDVTAVKNLKDKKLASNLLESVNEAAKLVDDYNSRLQQELVNRKQTALLLSAYIRQKSVEMECDQKVIEEWELKLRQVKSVGNELQTHLKSLPDLSSIEEAAILTPLPSAGDLFSS